MARGSSNGILGVLIIAGGVAVITVLAVQQRRRLRPHTVAEVEIPDVPMSADLGHLVALLNTAESEDDPQYRAAVERLRENSQAVIAEAGKLLGAAPGDPADNFALRHSVVLAVAALRVPGALGFLVEVALNPQPLPPVESPASDGLFDTLPEHRLDAEAMVQATIVALDAIDGIDALAGDGNTDALDALIKVSAAPSNAVRAAALTALGARPEWHAYRDKAMAGLPDDLRHLAHLTRKAVTDVPQIRDPRETLIGTGTATIRAPGLDDDSFRRSPVPGAPRAASKSTTGS